MDIDLRQCQGFPQAFTSNHSRVDEVWQTVFINKAKARKNWMLMGALCTGYCINYCIDTNVLLWIDYSRCSGEMLRSPHRMP